jgi:hypothetical protein
MLASLRAELLVLRKSRVAWALVLTVPLLTLVTTYVFGFVNYLGLTPSMYAQFGLLATLILVGYTLVFLGLAFLRLQRRDVAAASGAWFARRRHQESGPRAGQPLADVNDGRRAGVLASLRAELLVMFKWPAMWAFVLALPVFTLLNSYIDQYVLYLNAGAGAISLRWPPEATGPAARSRPRCCKSRAGRAPPSARRSPSRSPWC